jgi:hypothetical protein
MSCCVSSCYHPWISCAQETPATFFCLQKVMVKKKKKNPKLRAWFLEFLCPSYFTLLTPSFKVQGFSNAYWRCIDFTLFFLVE